MTNREILENALMTYGAKAQILMVMEEMAELQKELCKNIRGKANVANIAEEIADVRERYRLYQLTPPRKRHHRLNMEDAVVKKGARPDEQA